MQTVEKTFESNFSNNVESLHAQVYKKLWIDAEAALCSLKYELQLAKMKIEAENRNHETGIAVSYCLFCHHFLP